jgi:hypothetical protein
MSSARDSCASRFGFLGNGLLALLCLLGPTCRCAAQSFELGGSVRLYQFLLLSEPGLRQRHDAELAAARITSTTKLTPWAKFEAHALLALASPSASGAGQIVTSAGSPYFPFQHPFHNSESFALIGSFDRLNLQAEIGRVRLTIGRQAITWGVNYFWPAMDLFAPFSPQQVDRDYKPGVDAFRAVIPLGAFSETEIIGASLGPRPSDNWAAGALTRVHLGRADIGIMGGKFHRDTVFGAFVTAEVRGTGVRCETTWTESGDPRDHLIGHSRFVRASAGIDRQVTPQTSVTAEVAWNGFGASSAEDYPLLITSDRIQRGEVNAPGRAHAGMAVNWRLHPLLAVRNTMMLNPYDPSFLWIPALTWSTSNNSELLFGIQLGGGRGPGPSGAPNSEYGGIGDVLFAGFKAYF